MSCFQSLNFKLVFLLIFTSMNTLLLANNDSSSGGEVFKEIPTIHCLGVRWKIKGDQNKNAVINVSYKEKKATKWKTGYPLVRTLPNPHNSNRSKIHTVPGGWMFAGSIVGLKGDTEYEVKLNLVDPDGAKIEKKVSMKTWTEPLAPKSQVIKYVAPGEGGGSGTKADPYKGTAEMVKHLKPGTTFILKDGKYSPFAPRSSGTLDKPIIFKSENKWGANIDGGGNHDSKGSLVAFRMKKHLWFEGLYLTGKHYALNGNQSSHIVVRGNKFRKVSKGFNACKGGYNHSQRFFIVDNDYEGPTHWPRTRGIESYCLTFMSGSGHIVAYNKVVKTGDMVHGSGHGSWSSSDLYGNEMSICTDDGLETDHCEFNIRVWGNRIFNVAHGITVQPSRGGPVYIFRNLIYNATYSPFKLNNHTTGIRIFHNTCFKQRNGFNMNPASESVTNLMLRNNLFLTRQGYGLNCTTPNVRHHDLDNDGYGGFKTFAVWNRRHKYKTMGDAKSGGKIYKEKGAIKINPKTCFMGGTMAPDNRDKTYKFSEIDHRLAKGSDAIDKGVVLTGFNDGFVGKAPDLGALEFGSKIPHFGPRKSKK